MSISDWMAIDKFKPDPKKALLYFCENSQIFQDILSIYDYAVELIVNQREGLLNVDALPKFEFPVPRILILFVEISFQLKTIGLEKFLEFNTYEFKFLKYKDVVKNDMFSFDIGELSKIADPFSDGNEFDSSLAHKICRELYNFGKNIVGNKLFMSKPLGGRYISISENFDEGVTLYLIEKMGNDADNIVYIVALEVPVDIKKLYDDELNIDAASMDFSNTSKKIEITLEVIIEQSGVKEVEVIILPENNVITVKLVHSLFSQHFPLWKDKLQNAIIFTAADVPLTDDSIIAVQKITETSFYCKISDDTIININTINNPLPTTTTVDSAIVTESQPQRLVASRIFKRIVEVLVSDSVDSVDSFDPNTSLAKLQSKFQRIHFMILVPKYNTLRQQTKERIEKYSQLIRPDENSADFVYLYGNNGAVQTALKNWKDQIQSHDQDLYVLIVDECHYAPTREAIPILHDDEVTCRNNFIALLVSATPYNCLSDQSHIHANNVIRWDIQDEVNTRSYPNNTNQTVEGSNNNSTINSTISKPCYAGFEYYFRSLAFRLHPDNLEFSLTYTTSDTNGNENVRIILPSNREYGHYTAVASEITNAIKNYTRGELMLICEYKNASFSFSMKDKGATAKVEEIDGKKLLVNLGFEPPISLDSSISFISAAKNIMIDNLCTVESQHLRQDTGLEGMCEKILKHCPELKRIRSVKDRIGRLERHWDGLQGVIPGYRNSSHQTPMTALPVDCIMMTPKTGFTIILDYILSMAYFGSCRVQKQSIYSESSNREQVTLKTYVTTDDTNAILKEINVTEFLQMLEKCCYFEAIESCNLGKAMEVILELIISKLKKKEQQVNDYDEFQLLSIYLVEKYKAEGKASETSESESWYTETDRIIKMLLVDRDPAPMVLLRVYDHDENRSMQTILRHAIEVCQLTFTKPSSSSTFPSSSSSSSSSNHSTDTDNQRIPGFSVLGDISDTKLLNILEPYYKNEYMISGEYGRDGSKYTVSQIPQFRLQARNQIVNSNNFVNPPSHNTATNVTTTSTTVNTNNSISNKNNIKFSTDLKYEDLANIPCLVILCEKGRMGDTFPHNLRVLDLRLRTGGTASCFLQEIGRMCRYPKTKSPSKDDDKNKSPSTDDGNNKSPSTDDGKNGYMFVNKTTNGLEGFSKDRDRCQYMDASANLIDIDIRPLTHPLPYALIQPSVRKRLEEAIDQREEKLGVEGSNGIREQDKIINYLTMVGGVDDYLTNGKHNKTIDWTFKSKLKKSNTHYDLTNLPNSQHKLRFLLAAECQIGKTGAYLHLLHLLRCAIESPVHGSRMALTPVPPTLPSDTPWIRWEIPYWKSLQDQPCIDYKFPKYGKYHLKIARQRLDLYFNAMSSKNSTRQNVKDEYISLIKEYEHTISEEGQRLLQNLPDYYNTINNDNDFHEIMRKYVNWDGRLCAPVDNVTGARDFVGDVIVKWKEYQMQYQRRGLTYNAAIACFGNYNNCSEGVRNNNEKNSHKEQEARRAANRTMISPTVLRSEDYNPLAMAPLISLPGITTDPILYKSLSNTFSFYGAEGEFGLHIPLNAFSDDITQSTLNTIEIKELPQKLCRKDHQPQLEYWIFTPTFAGEGRAGPEEKLLIRDSTMVLSDRSKTLDRWKDYVEVLVLRSSQLEMYKTYYGSTHILATLPKRLYKDYGNEMLVDVEQGGCGFARRYCQILAKALGLKAIWMIDDNVQQCWQICNTGGSLRRGSVTSQPASFADLMMQIEQIFNNNNSNNHLNSHHNLGEIFEKIPPDLKSKFRNIGTVLSNTTPTTPTTVNDVTGDFSAYGIIGTCRGKQWRKTITHPIKISHSVYSFFLLNIEATVKERLLFPCRPIWEDIEFNNKLDEAGLVVCKMQRFAHCKPIRSQFELEEEEKLLEVSESVEEKMCQWLEKEISPRKDVVIEKLEMFPSSYEWQETLGLYDELIFSEWMSSVDNLRVITIVTNGIPPICTSGFFKNQPRDFRLKDLVIQVCESSSHPRCWVIIFPNSAHHILTSCTSLFNDDLPHRIVNCTLKVYELPEELSKYYLVVQLIYTEKLREEDDSNLNPAITNNNEVTEIDEIPTNITNPITTSSSTNTVVRSYENRIDANNNTNNSTASTRSIDSTTTSSNHHRFSEDRMSEDILKSPRKRSRNQALLQDSDPVDILPTSISSLYSVEMDLTTAPTTTTNSISSSTSCWYMDHHHLLQVEKQQEEEEDFSIDNSTYLTTPSSTILYPISTIDTMMTTVPSTVPSNPPLLRKYDVMMDLTNETDDRISNNNNSSSSSGSSSSSSSSNPDAAIEVTAPTTTYFSAYSDYPLDKLNNITDSTTTTSKKKKDIRNKTNTKKNPILTTIRTPLPYSSTTNSVDSIYSDLRN